MEDFDTLDADNEWFVKCVLESEESSTAYPRSFGIFLTALFCPGRRNQSCGKPTTERFRNGKLTWRCTDSMCGTF